MPLGLSAKAGRREGAWEGAKNEVWLGTRICRLQAEKVSLQGVGLEKLSSTQDHGEDPGQRGKQCWEWFFSLHISVATLLFLLSSGLGRECKVEITIRFSEPSFSQSKDYRVRSLSFQLWFVGYKVA